MIKLEEIENAGHIVIVTNNATFPLANVVYSYLLTLHKKISLTSVEPITRKFAFLPWFDKVRFQLPASVDMQLNVEQESIALYRFFQEKSIKINTKMATSFYAALLLEDEKESVLYDGEKLLIIDELLKLGANSEVCYSFLREQKSLALFRLKALIFAEFILKDEGKTAQVHLNDSMLKQSGANLQDALKIAVELLEIVHVEYVVVFDQNNKEIFRKRGREI